ncbi:MAG TPA: 6-phosphogluconolactonase [Candidatus Limnocylindrales bacterium]|nr:6-phosphogluconolactonase [Candidatus Limnocylindrales bacterium]
MNEPEIVVVADPDAAAVEAAARIATSLTDAVERQGRADWATTGGSTPVGIYRRLGAPPLVDAVPWASVHVWWGDDRYVPRDHPLSNVKAFDDVLLGIAGAEEGTAGGGRTRVPIPLANVHPFPTGPAIGRSQGPGWCAATLADELHDAGLDVQDGWPVFDLMLLGVGPDGHVLSVFPGSMAFDATELAMAVPAPSHVAPHVERVTLNPAVIGVARQVLVVALGADKAPVLAQILQAEREPRRWPAQLARRDAATWIVDEAAAADLSR